MCILLVYFLQKKFINYNYIYEFKFLVKLKEIMADQVNKENTAKVNYKETLNLPRTDFPIRANPKIEDKELLARWSKDDMFTKTFYHNTGKEKFILHDGPPYANGNIHLGHAYNKILKDIVCKSQRMLGKQVPCTPGWDCHGLPIEIKVTQDNKNLSPIELKKACREYASKWIDIQRKEFKELGVFMNWDKPYLTMDHSYEASILRAFGIFVEQGYIERKNKTVPWCPSDQTVLASAEIEYQERKDPSIYVLFPLANEDTAKHFPNLKDKVVNLLVWTTTPWTLPLNRAVLLRPHTEYLVLEANNVLFLVAKVLADKICALIGVEKKVIGEISSQKLITSKAIHPFILGLTVPVLVDQSVSLEDGTACVHCAPGCGPDDYEVGIKNNLEIYSPISPDGRYTNEIQPKELSGMSVADGQGWVINSLTVHGRLFYKTSIRHPYPHCWRCHNGLIFRATKQWFCDLSKENLRAKVIGAVEDLKMVPEKSHSRLKATLEGRLEWCLSRQRVWGVPIAAVLCVKCDHAFTNKKLIDTVAENVAKEGIEYWDKVNIKDLLPKDFLCEKCDGSEFKKEMDILDVWFDSGVSHYAVLENNAELQFPADMYLEGKDQHRGWFQSSLLTSMVIEKRACMKAIVTHGFTVDQTGKKMSKSIGNIVSPDELIDKLGTDGLRLWASSIDFKDDAVVSEVLLRNIQEVNRKIRNTCRFLLSNLYDFDITKDEIEVNKLTYIDQYALSQLYIVSEKIKQDYQDCKFTSVYHQLADYCTKDLSAFYLDIIKDRLYIERPNGQLRKSAQTVCWYILETLTKLMAPILSFTAELVSDNYQINKTESIHLQDFADITKFKNLSLKNEQELWVILKDIRNAILKSIEEQREQGLIKHSLEAHVTISLDINKDEFAHLFKFLNEMEKKSGQTIEEFFKEFLIVSQFNIISSGDTLKPADYKGLFIDVRRAQGDKCPRCWNYTITDHPDKLCARCQGVITD